MKYELKSRANDAALQLKQRRAEILDEYRFHELEPIKIGREPISIELALYLELLVDNRRAAE